MPDVGIRRLAGQGGGAKLVSAKPTFINGVLYPSRRAAGLALGIHHRTVSYRLDPAHAREVQKSWHINNRDKSRALRRRLAGKPEPTRPCPANCEICGDPFVKTAHLDHVHETNVFRGWLCSRCNTAIGLLRDSPQIAMKAAEYLGLK